MRSGVGILVRGYQVLFYFPFQFQFYFRARAHEAGTSGNFRELPGTSGNFRELAGDRIVRRRKRIVCARAGAAFVKPLLVEFERRVVDIPLPFVHELFPQFDTD
jgi:hypothetical protein